MNPRDRPTRPVVRYHGGKWLLAPWIIEHFPEHRTYIEPFGGGGSVLLRKPRSYAEIYNDRWGDIVNVFRVLRDPETSAQLEKQLRLTPFARDEFELSREPSSNPVEQARRMIFRSMAGFGSDAVRAAASTGFRANSQRSGTTAAQDWMNYPDQLQAFTSRLQGVVIENRDALDVIAQHDRDDALIYVDPPYVHETRVRVGKTRGYAYELTNQDHEALAEVLHRARGAVVLSGYASPLYDRLYVGWRRLDRATHADGGKDRVECLWLSPRCRARQMTLAA